MYRIEKYLDRETTEYEGRFLVFSQNRLDLITSGEEILSGEISIAAQTNGQQMYCLFYSSHYRMQCVVSELAAPEGVLQYRFDGRGLDDGEEVRGEFSVVSGAGEYRIPYLVRIEKSYSNEKYGSIRNLFHFANLAREDFDEAVRFFYLPQFISLLSGHDRRYLGLYRGLSASPGDAGNVDAFLVAIHKKQEITYHVREEKLILQEVHRQQKETVTLERTGWGYTHVTIEAGGGFLRCEKDVLTEEDFVGNRCVVSFFVNPERLRQGYNTGRLVFYYGRHEEICDIVVRRPYLVEKHTQGRREYKKLVAGMMQQYLEYVTGSPDPAACLKKAEKIIEKMNTGYSRMIEGRLYQSHVLMEQSRENEARWVLTHVENKMEQEKLSDSAYAYYLYLKAQLEHGEDDTQRALGQLRDMASRGEGGALAVCFYLRLLPHGEMGQIKRLAMYEEQFYRGSASPVLLRDAWRVLEDSMAYLTKLGKFEIMLLRFAMRYGLYTKEAAMRVNDLVKRKKDMDRALFELLGMGYRIFPDDETVHALCSLMIRIGLTHAESFPWYALAVEKELRITSLYEYYMLSVNMDKKELPPKMVLLYFSYACSLPDARRAYLYSLIISHRHEISQIFAQYEQQLEEFGWKQMEKHVMSENHAVIYRYLLRNHEGMKKAENYLMQLGFVHMISVSDNAMANVVVIHDMLAGEKIYPIEKGAAFVECYTDAYTIILEDKEGKRYFDDALWTDKKLMPTEKIALFLQQKGETSVAFLLHRESMRVDENLSDADSWRLYETLALSGEVEAGWRRRMLDKLMELYYERDMTERLMRILEHYPVENTGQKQRGQLLRYYIACGQDEKAFSLLYEYGFEGASAKVLARLLGRHLTFGTECDARLLALTYYCFKQGKYTEDMLAYLGSYFEGDIKQMRDIWKAAVDFEVEVPALAERILLTHLFGNGYISQMEQVFDYYVAHAGRESLIKRYVRHHAYACFVWQQQPQKSVFARLERYLIRGMETDGLSKLSYLYYMAREASSYTKEQEMLIEALVEEFIFTNRYVPFFAAFLPIMPWLSLYTQHTYIEYRTKPKTTVCLHYMIDDDENYRIKQMTEIGGGYYCESFLLLYSQRLRYYFVERDGEKESLTESGEVEKSDMAGPKSRGRFGLLNDIMLSCSMGDDKTADALTREYLYESSLHEILGGSMKWKL